jgi:SAM-dependent methyltransferase
VPPSSLRHWIAPEFPPAGAHRNEFIREFGRQLCAVPERRGRVLDIGCGVELPVAIARVAGELGPIDGVDPDPGIAGHPSLIHRWQERFESAPIPASTYGLAYAYNVLEHIAEPRPFFAKVAAVLEPGGVFLALAPNARHPFAWTSRAVDVLGVKAFAARALGRRAESAMLVNAYPSYYRCNSPAAIHRAIEGLGFERVSCTFVPCVQWEMYFPAWLRWVPWLWDRVVSARVPSMNQVLMVRMEKRT